MLVSVRSDAQENAMLMTKWGETVTAEKVHPEYPRPQMVRELWQNLNGLWDYAITNRSQTTPPENYDGEILVPFPIESALSGVKRGILVTNVLWYRRTINTSVNDTERLLLHFGVVDWETQVWVNGVEIGNHRGGYDPFSFDITSALNDSGEQEIIVRVWDPMDTIFQPRGKQVRRPQGIWYTPTTGIWQTVWLETVPQSYINSFKIVPNIDEGTLTVGVDVAGTEGEFMIRAEAIDDGTIIADGSGSADESIVLSIDSAKLWSPDSPYLYDLRVSILSGNTVIDTVDSYFGMRKIEIAPDSNGDLRIVLNNEPVFNYGLLDQGFWPDGLYTPPTDEALRYDIEITKQLGFNTIRKHVKVEPARWYYWADRLGVLVWQDMPSGDQNMGRGEGELVRIEGSAQNFELELTNMINYLYNHPSIVMWVVFNEGWGQFDTARMTEFTRNLDNTRIINSVSGWTDMDVGDVHDIHQYPGPALPPESPGRALVLGEFGGLGLSVEGHMWDAEFWGYRAYKDVESLTKAYTDLLEALRPMITDNGLAAAIYTQTTDVETEANGMLTYDRAIIKMDIETIRALNESLYFE